MSYFDDKKKFSADKNFQWHYPASSVCQSQVSGKFLRTFVFSDGNAIELKLPAAVGNSTPDL